MHLGMLLISLGIALLMCLGNTQVETGNNSTKDYDDDDSKTTSSPVNMDLMSASGKDSEESVSCDDCTPEPVKDFTGASVIFSSDSNATTTVPFDPTKHPSWNLLDNEDCGDAIEDKIVGGKDASMGDFPWIALLGYTKTGIKGIHYACGGVLINQWYVLTAAHCTKVTDNEYTLVRIRLGEHNLKTNPDCDKYNCNARVQEYNPAEINVHALYNKINVLEHDIALIRLEKKATYSDWVKPICMVFGPLMEKNFTGEFVTFAGWGIYDVDRNKRSEVLQTITETIAPSQLCQRRFGRKVNITNTQLCVQGNPGEDTCAGDSGGPAMYVDDLEGLPRYFVIGLLSFGATDCGENNAPSVATAVAPHMKWILDNIRP